MNTIKTTIALALSIAALTANAQHATTITISGNDHAHMVLRNDGPVDIVGAELFTGSPQRDRVTFAAAGTDGDLAYPFIAGSGHYSVTTLTADLQTGEAQTFGLNLDQIALDDVQFFERVYDPAAYSAMRITVFWLDGFEARIPMSRGLGDALFNYADFSVSPTAVPEPASGVLMLLGLAAVPLMALRRRGGAKPSSGAEAA